MTYHINEGQGQGLISPVGRDHRLVHTAIPNKPTTHRLLNNLQHWYNVFFPHFIPSQTFQVVLRPSAFWESWFDSRHGS